MASNRTTYSIGFEVDANKAQQQINNLTKTLQNLTKQNKLNLGLDEDIRKATESAKVLQSTLSKALDINTGKIDFSAFTSELKKANTSVAEIANNLLNAGSAGQAAFAQMSASLASSEVQINKINNAITRFGQTLKNTVKWEISSNIVHGIESALNNAISYAKDLNSTLNDIRIVSGASAEEMTQFAISANKAAQTLSTTTNEFAKASLIYYQQGDSAALAAEKATITTKAANIAFTASAKEMSQMLTAVWNSYQMGSDQLEHAVDVMAKLGATTASSTEEIATAMQKVAPTANNVGVSFEKMSAIIATSASVTRQSAETVGTAWNTILSRIGGLKLGETLEDGVDLNKYSSALKTVGVNVLDTSGNLREMGDVIDDLGAKWQTLNTSQKAALAQTVGGARNYTQITAFFENFDKFQKNMISANNAEGELNKQADTYAQSWEAATKRQKAALESLYDSIINDKAMITMTDGLTTIIGLVEGLVSGLGGIPGILSNIGLIANRVFKDQITAGLANAGRSLANMASQIKQNGFLNTVSMGLQGKLPSSAELRQAQAAQEAATAATNRSQFLATRDGYGLESRSLATQGRMLDAKANFALNGRSMTSNQQMAFQQRMERASDAVMASAASQNSYNALINRGNAQYGRGSDPLNNLRRQARVSTVLNSQGFDTGMSGLGAYDLSSGTPTGLLNGEGIIDENKVKVMQQQAAKMSAMLKGIGEDITEEDGIGGAITALTEKLDKMKNTTAEQLEEQVHRLDKSKPSEFEEIAGSVEDEFKAILDQYKEAVKQGIDNAVGETDEDIDAAQAQGREEGLSRTQAESDLADIDIVLDDNSEVKADKFEKVAQGIQKVGTMAMSAVAGISSMSGMMDTLGDSSATTQQKIGAVMGAASTLANAFATGGPWAAVATGAAMAAVAVIKSIDAQIAKQAEYRRKQGEAAIEAVNNAKEEKAAADEQYETYKDLQKAYEEGEASHQEYVDGLTSVADALDIEGAKVLALTGNYEGLAQAIESANKKRLEQEVTSANSLVQQTTAQAGNILESTLNEMSSTVKRRGSKIIVDNVLSDAFSELENSSVWSQINSQNATGQAADFKTQYGLSSSDQGWEAIAAIMGGTQGGDTGNWFGASIFDRNANNLTLETSPEQILAMYEHILELQEKAQDTSTFEGQAIAELLSTSKISQLVDAITAAAQPLQDAKAMQRSSQGALYLEDKYAGTTKDAYSAEKRESMVQDLMSTWDFDRNNEAEVENARKLAKQLVDNFWMGVDDGLEAALAQTNQADENKEKIKKYVKERYDVDLSDEDFAGLNEKDLLAANQYDLNYTDENNQFNRDVMRASIGNNGAQNNAVQRYNSATSALDSFYAGDYDPSELGRQMIEQLFSDPDARQAALDEFEKASVYEQVSLLNKYAGQLNNSMDSYFDKANSSIKDANKEVTARVKQLEKEANDFVDSIPTLDKEMDWEGFKKLYDIYTHIADAAKAGSNLSDLNTEDILTLMSQTGVTNEQAFTGLDEYSIDSIVQEYMSLTDSSIEQAVEELGIKDAVTISTDGEHDFINEVDYSAIDPGTFLAWLIQNDEDATRKIMNNISSNASGTVFSDDNISKMQTYMTTENNITGVRSELDADAVNERRAAGLKTRLDNQLAVKTSDYDDLSAMTKAGFISGDAEALAWIDMTEIQRKEQALKAMKQTLIDLKATGSLNEVDESLYNSKIRLQEIEVLQSKIQDTSTLQGLSRDAQEQEQLYKQGQEYYTQLLALYDKDSVEYKQTLANKEAATTAYYSQFESKAESAAAVIQAQWDKELNSASNVISIISSNLESLDKLDFQNIDNLKRNLVDAGISASRVEEIINNINNAATSEDKIKAGMVAATEAALAKLSTLGEQKQEYTGVITKLDMSPVADAEIPMQATLKNAEDVESWSNQNGKIVYTTEKDDTFTQDITNLKIQDGKIFYTIDAVDKNGQAITVSREIQSWIKNPADAEGNYSITIQTDAGPITTAITDAVVSKDGYSVEVTLGDKTKQSLPIELQETIDQVSEDNPEGLDLNANVDLVATGDLQGQIDEMDLSATVNLKGNITDTALNDYFTSIINGIYANSDDILKATQLLSQPFEQMFETLKEEQDWQFLWNKGSNVSWDSASQYLMVNLVQSVTKMSKTELKGLGPNVLKQIIDSLSNAIAHGDTQTAYLAQQLFAGLYTGIAEEGDGIAWETALREAGVSEDIIAAFKSELGIHSPSELTKALAKYLFDGLVEGIEEGDESFSAITLTNTKEKIAESVTNAINATGLEKLISDAYKDALTNATTANDLASLGLSESLAIQIVDAGGLQNAAEINGANAMAAAQEKNDRERAALTAQMTANTSWSKDYIAKQVDAYIPKLSQEELEQIRNDAIESFVDEVTSDIDASKFTKDYIKNKKWNQEDISDMQKHIYNGALEAAMKELNFDNIESLNDDQMNQLMEKVQEKLNTNLEDLEVKIEDVWNEIQTVWQNGLLDIYKNETELATKTYNLWKDTFSAIANAREGLMNGQSILQSMYSNPDEIAKLISNWLNEGYKMSEIYEMLNDPDALSKLNFNAWDAEAYDLSGNQRFLNKDAAGNYTDTSIEDYLNNIEQYVKKDLGPHLEEVMDESLDVEALQKSTNTQDQALYQILKETGFIDENNQLTIDNQSIDEVYAAVVNAIADGATQIDVDALLGTASATQLAARENVAMQARAEAENQISEWQTNQDLINTAIAALTKDGNLNSMNLDDQNKLVSVLQDMHLLGENADASNISLQGLTSAADTLAEHIATLAQEIMQAMSMIKNGEADSWQIGENGHVTMTSSYATAEANGFAGIDENVVNETKEQIMIKAKEAALTALENAGFKETDLDSSKSVSGLASEIYNQAYDEAEKKAKQEVKFDVPLGSDSVSDKEAGETITGAQNAIDEQQVTNMKNYADACGMAIDAYEALAQQVTKASGATKNFNNLSAEEKTQIMGIVTATKKAETAWSNLATKQKDAIELIKTGDTTNLEYLENLNSVTASVKDIFGGATAITSEFVKNHITDIELMAQGDEEAAERVEDAWLEAQAKLDGWDLKKTIEFDVNQDGLINELDTVGELFDSYFDQWQDKEIGFELTADDTQAIEALQNLVDSGVITADGINEALAGIGWEPEIEWVKMSPEMKSQQQIGATVYDFQGNPFQVTEEALANSELDFYMPQIKSLKKKSTGVRSMPQSVQRQVQRRTERPRPTRTPREREERPREVREDDAASRESEAKRNEDIERYHQVNKQLEHQSLMLERVNKLKTAKYGGDYLKALRQENEELRRQAKIQEEKFKQAQEYLAFDRKRLENLQSDTISWWTEDGQTERSTTIASLGLGDLTPMFDEEGNLDYQDLMEKLNARYNEMREKYMSDPETYGQMWDEFQSWYDQVSEYISQYEESLANTQQYINQMLDQINQLSSNNAEIIKYKVQLEIEEINFDKSWEDYLQKAWSGELEHVADILSSKFKQIIGRGGFITDENGQQRASGGVLRAIDTYMSEMQEAKDKYDVYKQYKTQIDEFAKDGSNIEDIKALIGQDFINEADYAEIIKTVRTNLLTELNNLEEYRNALATSYENAITLAQQEWNKYQQIIDHNTSLIDTFKELAQLTGEAQRDADRYREWSKEMNTAQLDAYDDMITQSTAMYNTHRAQLDALMEKANGDLSNLTDEEREQYEKSLAAMQSAEDQKLAYVKKKLELLRAEYEETVDDILRKLQDAMLSTTGSISFEDLASDYDWYNEQQERYLSSAQELYEVSKLNRNINDAIANTTNKASKERLQALQNTINKQSELNKLTDYDVQQMGLQYELAMALDELENARNNKSIVRLTRDEYGNMGYQYTADEDQTSAAQQKYEDILQKINDTAAARVKELEQSYIQTMNDYYTQARQIALEYADDEETRNAKLQELAERTKNRLQFLSEQMNIANANLMESNTAIFEHYQDDVERYVGTPDSSEGINPIITELSSKWQEHQELIDQNVKDITDALHTYLTEAQQTADATGTSMSTMSDKVTEAGRQNEYAAASMSQVTTALSEQYGELNEATESWKAYAEAIEVAKQSALDMLEEISEELDNLGIDDASSIWGALGYGGTGSGTGSSTQSSGPAGGGGVGKVDTVKYSIKDLTGDDEDGITGVPVKGDYKNGATIKTLNAGGTYTFSKMKGSYVWSDDAGGWINIQYLDREQSKISDYSTTGLLLSDAIAQYRVSNGFKTGGLVDYTGPAWVDGTPSAPEYVLNSKQTDQMFNAIDAVSNLDVELIKDIFGTIGMMATTVFTNLNGMLPSDFNTQSSTDNSKNIEQHIEIHAEFPDASDYAEIKEAFDSLANTATQYAFR